MRWVLLLSPFQRRGKLRPREVKCLTQRQGQSGCASSQAVCSLDFLLCSFQCFLAPAPPKVPSNNVPVWHLTVRQPGYEGVSSRSWRAFNPRTNPFPTLPPIRRLLHKQLCSFSPSFVFCCSPACGVCPSSLLFVGAWRPYPAPLNPQRGAPLISYKEGWGLTSPPGLQEAVGSGCRSAPKQGCVCQQWSFTLLSGSLPVPMFSLTSLTRFIPTPGLAWGEPVCLERWGVEGYMGKSWVKLFTRNKSHFQESLDKMRH